MPERIQYTYRLLVDRGPTVTRTFDPDMNEPTSVAVEQWFKRYLHAREAWERNAWARYQLAVSAGVSTLSAETDGEYAAIATKFFDPPIVDDSLVYGEPPGVNAATTRIMSITATKPDRVTITTQEWSRGLVTEHRYRLRLIDGEWRLVDRYARPERSWIKRLR